MRRTAILATVVLVLAGGAGWYFYSKEPQSATAAAGATKGAPRGPGMGATPVVAAAAVQGDIDIIVNGLGTVTPLRTVTVRSRVDGELVRVLFEEGQTVKEGQLLAEIDSRPIRLQLAQAEGQLARDQALLENARLDLERYKTLFQQDSIARQQVDTQASLVRQYEGVVRIDQSQVENARLQLAYSRVAAPISGRIGLRQVDPGNMIRAGDANGLAVITQVQPAAVLFTVPQDLLPVLMRRVQSGDSIPVEAWDREQKMKLADGVLASADNQVDPQTGTVKLKARFDNADAALFPNQFVNVRMKLDTLRGAVIVPSAAVQRGAQGLFVYVVRGDSTAGQRPVKLGPAEGLRVSIADGLAPGDLVVVDGMDRLRPGAQVEVTGARPEIKPPPEGSRKKGKGRKSE